MTPKTRIAEIVKSNDVVLFMKGTALFPQCGFSSRAVAILDRLGAKYETVDVLQDPEVRQGIKQYSRLADGSRSSTSKASSSAARTS